MIVGAGYIGLEMAEALHARGLTVTVVEQLPNVLPTVDPELGALVRAELERHGVESLTGTTVNCDRTSRPGTLDRLEHTRADDRRGDRSRRRRRAARHGSARPRGSRPGRAAPCRSTAGWKPTCRTCTRPATASSPTIACSRADSYLPLGTTAHKQGRVAGENAVGGSRSFAGHARHPGRQDLRARLRPHRAPRPRSRRRRDRRGHRRGPRLRPQDLLPRRPDIAIRHRRPPTDRLLGVQLVGHRDTQVPKRIDVAAAALHHGMTVDGLNDLDLSYTPPFGSPWDPLQTAAQEWTRVQQTQLELSRTS